MSYHVEALCDRHRFGSATRKQIIMYLANKASDDGTGIWCSKHTIARHTELSLATVKRIIRDFLAEGMLVATGMRDTSRHGQTVVYRIVLETVEQLELLLRDKAASATGVSTNPVQPAPTTGVTVPPQPGSVRPPNNPKNNPMNPPPPRDEAQEVADSDLDPIWAVYPEDRRRDRAGCRRHLAEALIDATVEELTTAAKAYARETEGFTRLKVSFLDNWLRDGKWRRHVDDARRDSVGLGMMTERSRALVVHWVKTRSALCGHLREPQVREAVELGLLTVQEAQAAGFMR